MWRRSRKSCSTAMFPEIPSRKIIPSTETIPTAGTVSAVLTAAVHMAAFRPTEAAHMEAFLRTETVRPMAAAPIPNLPGLLIRAARHRKAAERRAPGLKLSTESLPQMTRRSLISLKPAARAFPPSVKECRRLPPNPITGRETASDTPNTVKER